MPTTWPAPAKINLFLHVTGRRPDGYHELQTLFQFVDRCDELSFALRADGAVRRVSTLAGVAPEDDLVVRAAMLLKRATGATAGADIHVVKRLPLGGGLGGGSSDAATVLVALNELWGTGLPPAALAALGLELGADVPVFVRGEAAWAEGVGEVLTPCPGPETAVLVITPPCHVETGRVFAAADLTRDTPRIKMPAFSLSGTGNDCERVTRRLYPEVGEALDWLNRRRPARMSGTGASVYALFDDIGQAEELARQVPQRWPHFCARRRNRSPLLDCVAAWRTERAAGR
jgi:4-diphosphocytidyl-2-C-methyl-D-erythritol kinase